MRQAGKLLTIALGDRGGVHFSLIIFALLLLPIFAFVMCSGSDGTRVTPSDDGIREVASFQTKHKPVFDANEKGQVVWTVGSDDSTDVYLLDNNRTARIRTTSAVVDDLSIEDTGEVLWTELTEDAFTVYAYQNGNTAPLFTENTPNIMNFDINPNGTCVWTGLGENDTLQIYQYKNGSITPLTTENNNILPQINDSEDITWVEITDEAYYIHFLSRDGVHFPRINENQVIDIPSESELPAYFVDMNENGHLVWNAAIADSGSGQDQVFLFENGITTQLTDNGKECARPRINDAGQIVYHAFFENAVEINSLGVFGDSQLIARANEYFSLPELNDNGMITWSRLDENIYQLLIRDDQGDVKELMESDDGYFPSDPLLVGNEYVVFLDGEWDGGEFEYQSLYVADLASFSLWDDVTSALIQEDAPRPVKTADPPVTTQAASQTAATETVQPPVSVQSDQDWSFTVLGDTRGLDHATWGARALADPWNQAALVWAVQTQHTVLQPKPEIILMNGDMESWMYKSGTTSPFVENLKTWDAYFALLDRNRVFPIKGNHELFYARVCASPKRMRKMQTEYTSVIQGKYPHVWNATTINANTDYRALAYMFVHRNALFVVFDTNYMAPGAATITGKHDISSVTQDQVDWFNNQVVTSPEYRNAKYRFALTHYTLFPSIEPQKGINENLLKSIAKHKFDAFFGACEHLYTDKLNVSFRDGSSYPMPIVTVGSLAKSSFDSQSDIKNPGAFNRIVTEVPGLLRIHITENTFVINLVTPTSYERKAFAGYKVMAGIKVDRTSGEPVVSNVQGAGMLGPGRYNATIPNSVPSCDCAHRSGGCYIERPPGPGTACHCTNMGFLGCAPDTIVQCQNILDYNCIHPDPSKNTCLQGGGNCGGY